MSRSSESSQRRPVPQRQRSVRFLIVPDNQLDGQVSEQSEMTPTPTSRARDDAGSHESQRSRHSHKVSEKIEALAAKLNTTNGSATVVHKANAKPRMSVPYINPNGASSVNRKDSGLSISTASSYSPQTRDAWATWSPANTASTGATSLTSPGSSTSRYKQGLTPDDGQTSSKPGPSNGDENTLPPIEEDCGRFLWIPVQEAEILSEPTVTTVENAAAAKYALEQLYHDLLMEPVSPRSMRRKRFEQQLCDFGMAHNERVEARQLWLRSESDHLRQMRVLKASSLARQNLKGVSIAGFNVLRVLGKGSFGVVRLVNERTVDPDVSGDDEEESARDSVSNEGSETSVSRMDGTAKCNLPAGKPLSDVFAMKVIRKSDMLRACQEGHLRAERDFLVGAEGSRWVVPLIASFQDNTNLYLVMEYMIGGDFLGLLLREDVLEEQVAQ